MVQIHSTVHYNRTSDPTPADLGQSLGEATSPANQFAQSMYVNANGGGRNEYLQALLEAPRVVLITDDNGTVLEAAQLTSLDADGLTLNWLTVSAHDVNMIVTCFR